nr:MAG TPA: hypothetical protein [Bacteriophage sp.]
MMFAILYVRRKHHPKFFHYISLGCYHCQDGRRLSMCLS